MRMMVTMKVPPAAGNRAIKDHKLVGIIEKTIAAMQPECCYFMLDNGHRTMRAVFDLKNQHDQISIFEPAMIELDASIELIPVMNGEDLHRGFAAMG